MMLNNFFARMPDFEEQLRYELDDKGERVLIKSFRSEKRAYIRFVNRTSRLIDVWWRDYQGHRRHYARMKPRTFYITDTYITHPWEFTDAYTSESYVINNKEVFRAPECLANVRYRSTWYISVGMRSLLNTALLSIATKLTDVSQVESLGLPKPLADDLSSLVEILKVPARIQNS